MRCFVRCPRLCFYNIIKTNGNTSQNATGPRQAQEEGRGVTLYWEPVLQTGNTGPRQAQEEGRGGAAASFHDPLLLASGIYSRELTASSGCIHLGRALLYTGTK